MTPARADVITQHIFFSYSGAQPDHLPIEIPFAQFDATLGTLTDITLRVYGSYHPSFIYVSGNFPPFPPSIDLASSLSLGILGLTDLGTHTAFGNGSTFYSSNTGFSFDKTIDLLPDPYFENPPFTALGIDYNLTSRPISNNGLSPSNAYDQTSSVGFLDVTYNFVVPEPSSLALVMSALVCLCGVLQFGKTRRLDHGI